MRYRVLCADVSDALPALEPESFDAVLCDPPYGLSFMGKQWDHGVPGEPIWRMVAAALKPGAHLLAFGGTRTYHRLACAIEDAGFEVRDCLSWNYATGFPKSLDISKAIDKMAGAEREVVGDKLDRPGYHLHGHVGGEAFGHGLSSTTPETRLRAAQITAPATDAAKAWQGYGTALKPAWEPCLLAMKPLRGTFAENALAFGVAGLNVDGGRIGTSKSIPNGTRTGSLGRADTAGYRGGWGARSGEHGGCDSALGRWPANLLLDEAAAAALDEQSGERKSGSSVRGDEPSIPAMHDGGLKRVAFSSHGDSGGASRFFYVAKASRREREAGLEGLPKDGRRVVMASSGRTVIDGEWVETHSEPIPRTNHHPTVKPLALCEYLARLILPPKRDTPRRLLVPFSGSGSEMIGALLAGWDEVVGIEREAEYVAIAEARLRHWIDKSTPLFAEVGEVA